MMLTKSILCLGDSYTIGEGVPLYESYPYILVQQLRNANCYCNPPEIIAKTGFTSSELLQQIAITTLLDNYDYATLLIGVNNQYRGLALDLFEQELDVLMKLALNKVNSKANKVVVLSIPNWGVTPFAHDRNEEQITQEIHEYNEIVERKTQEHHFHFVNITPQTVLAKENSALLTTDNLHYSKISHSFWANCIAEIILKEEKI